MKSIPKIVFSGGPCGGKTQAIKYIKEHLEKLGFHVVTVTESAANVLADGFDRNLPTYEFQKAIALKQIENENNTEETAKKLTAPRYPLT